MEGGRGWLSLSGMSLLYVNIESLFLIRILSEIDFVKTQP